MRIGIHAPTEGATQVFHTVATALAAEAVLWMWSEGPQDTQPGWTNLVRLFTPTVREDATAYAQRVAPIIGKWYASGIPAIFIPGNEVDLEGPWSQDDWEFFLPQYVDVLRRQWSGIVLACPAYSTTGMAMMSLKLVAPFDAICAHSYFPADVPSLIDNEAFGAAWKPALRVAGGKPVWITEANSNPTNPAQIAAWLGSLDSGIAGVTFFISDSGLGHPGFPEYVITVDQAGAIRAAHGSPVATPLPRPRLPLVNAALNRLVAPLPRVGMALINAAINREADATIDVSATPFAFDQVAEATYLAMVRDGSIRGRTSPFLTHAMYATVMQVAHDRNISARLLLAWTRSENNQATNISDSLLGIHNYAGIKYVGQQHAYRSSVFPPPNEGGVYAGFNTDDDFWYTLAVNIQSILPEDYAQGNLGRIASYYTIGDPDAGAGANKVTFWKEYSDRTTYPGPGPSVLPDPDPNAFTGITGQTIADTAATYLGMTAFIDEGRSVQASGQCQEFVEVINEQCGVPRNRRPSALEASQFYGPLNAGRAPAGAAVYFDGRVGSVFGHAGIACGDGTMISALATVRIDSYEMWAGYIGWNYYPGVGEGASDMPLPRDAQIDDGEIELAWSAFDVPLNPDAAIFLDWKEKVYGQGIPLGVPTKAEQAFDNGGRVLQPFSSGLVAQWTQQDGHVIWLGTLP